ncbi:MAG: SUMF1/EgtB/PvdO family nonheme iron enzyme [Polyangiaceae bacterium]|nr:SUMF1/EgtB/PvdO family nonheme iron enzyme [Polyangiaceae bacterium]
MRTISNSGIVALFVSLLAGCGLDDLPNNGRPGTGGDEPGGANHAGGGAGGGSESTAGTGNAPETDGGAPGGGGLAGATGWSSGGAGAAGASGGTTTGGIPGQAGAGRGGVGGDAGGGDAGGAGAGGANSGGGANPGGTNTSGGTNTGGTDTGGAGGNAGAGGGGSGADTSTGATLQGSGGGLLGGNGGAEAGTGGTQGGEGGEGDANRPPEIVSVGLSAEYVLTGGIISLWVEAVDPEGMPLSFEWFATGGAIGIVNSTTTTSAATWIAPASAGSQVVTVMVRDPLEAVVSHEFTVVSVSCTRPTSTPGGPTMKLLPAGFCMDTTEVTRAQYQAWLANEPDPAAQDPVCSGNSTFAPDTECLGGDLACHSDCDGHPQICVDWCDAAAYCKAVGKRLCGAIGGGASAWGDYQDADKDQWYRACTAGGEFKYPYGNNWDEHGSLCNGPGGHRDKTEEAGSSPNCVSADPDYGGVYDLSANVWEWTDACETTEADANCRTRGGCFLAAWGPTLNIADYPYNTDACNYGSAVLGRHLSNEATGFRCCSD